MRLKIDNKLIAIILGFIFILQISINAMAYTANVLEYYDFNGLGDGGRPSAFWCNNSDDASIGTESYPSATNKSLAIEGSEGHAFIQRSYSADSPLTGKLYIEYDVRFSKLNSSSFRVELTDISNQAVSFLSMSNGVASLYNGTMVFKYVEDKFYRISLAMDLDADKVNVWVDGRQRVFNDSISGLGYSGIIAIRLQLTQISSHIKINLDNLKIATGIDRPDKEDNSMEQDEITNTVTVADKMKSAIALYENRAHALVNGEKIDLDAVPFSDNQILFVPIRVLAQSLGGGISYDSIQNTVKLVFDGKIYTFSCDNDTVLLNGEKTDGIITKNKDSSLYVDVAGACNIFEKEVFEDKNNGLVIFSNVQNFISWDSDMELLNQIVESFIYTDYTGEELIHMLKENNPDNKHPRMLITDERLSQILTLQKTDPYMQKCCNQIIANANNLLNVAPQKYEIPDGIRLLEAARTVRDRVANLGLAYQLTGNSKYAQRCWDEMYIACYYPDWNPKHFLDPSELSAGLAMGYDWIYDWMNDDQRKLVRSSLVNFGLNRVMEDYNLKKDRERTYLWSESDPPNNWTMVCNGGMAQAALVIGDEEDCSEVCGQVLSDGLVNVRRILKAFAPSGSYNEGPGYWNYATNYFSLYVGSLDTALGTDCGIFDVPGMRNTVDFIESLNGPTSVYNYSDVASNHPVIRSQNMVFFANKLNKPYYATKRIEEVLNGKQKAQFEDILFYKADMSNSKFEFPLDKYSNVAEVAAMRSAYTEDAMYVGFHNGKNNESHGHFDKGGFVIDSQGERFIKELGYDDYNLPGRTYDRYRYRAEGHNTLVFNPDNDYDQLENANVKIEKFITKPRGAYAIADLTSAYADDVTSSKRGIMLNDGRNSITVSDEITMKEPGEVWWFAHTDAEIELSKCHKTAILTMNGKKMSAQILSDGYFEVMDAKPFSTSPEVPGQATNDETRKLAIHLKNFKTGNISVLFSNYYEEPGINEVLPLEKWSIPDGEITYATVSEIKVNGVELEGFNPNIFNYHISLPALDSEIKYITSDGQVADMRDEGNPFGTIVVVKKESDDIQKPYVIIIEPTPIIGIPDNLRPLEVVKYEASDEPQTENSAQNAFDDSMETRWAALGQCYMDIDLGRTSKIDGVGIAFWKGNARKSRVTIEVSDNGEEFEKVYEGTSCGMTEDTEVFIAENAVGRYIRINFYGTSAGEWNSILNIVPLIKSN